MIDRWVLAIALSAVVGITHADNLCALDPYKKNEAELGKMAFDSHRALCHQYNMTGGNPGNYMNESPDINLSSESDLKFLDGGGGAVLALLGEKFFSKQKGKTLAEFGSFVSSAANSFPPKDAVVPLTYFQVAAYVLYKNCGRM
jgi:hypothetical protein